MGQGELGFDFGAGIFADRFRLVRLSMASQEKFCQCLRVSGRENETVFTVGHAVVCAGSFRGNYRETGGHCFQQNYAEAFVYRGKYEGIGLTIPSGDFLWGKRSG